MSSKGKKSDAIICGYVYTLDAFMARTGLGRASMRKIRQRCSQLGLELIKYEGRCAFVRGDDWHEYLGRRKNKSVTDSKK